MVLAPLLNQLTVSVRVSFWTFSSIPLIYMLIFRPVLHCLHFCSFVTSFETGKCESSNFVFLFKIVLAILNHLHFHMNFRISLPTSAKKPYGILIGNALNLQINLGNIAVFTTLSLPIHKYKLSFHLFRCSLISLNNGLQGLPWWHSG